MGRHTELSNHGGCRKDQHTSHDQGNGFGKEREYMLFSTLLAWLAGLTDASRYDGLLTQFNHSFGFVSFQEEVSLRDAIQKAV